MIGGLVWVEDSDSQSGILESGFEGAATVVVPVLRGEGQERMWEFRSSTQADRYSHC